MTATAPTAGRKPRRKRIPQEHYDTVSTMLISMVPVAEIKKQLSMRWAKPRTYVMDIIEQVHHEWAADAALVADTRRHQVRASFERIMVLASQQTGGPDLGVMVRATRELGLLDGCYVPNEVNVNHTGAVGHVGISLGGLGFKSPDEVRERIEELKATLAAQGPKALTTPVDTATAMTSLGAAPNDVIDIQDPTPTVPIPIPTQES